MAGKRTFTTLPARAIADQRLSGLELRCLAAISMHDGMSIPKGTGMGCTAAFSTLARLVGTDMTNMTKAISRLAQMGYIVREPQQIDRRRSTLRVVFGDDDSWRNDQPSASGDPVEAVGEMTNYPSAMVGEPTNQTPKMVGDDDARNGGISKENGLHYIPLNGELNSVKRRLHSTEVAQLASRAARVREDSSGRDDDDRGSVNASVAPALGSKKDHAKALATRKVSIWAKAREISPRFDHLPSQAQLCQFERAFKELGSNPNAIDERERQEARDWLFSVADASDDNAIIQHANRLEDALIPC